MTGELHVQYRLPAGHARKLKALASLHGMSPNVLARSLLVAALDDTTREDMLGQLAALHEELAALRAEQREQAAVLAKLTAALRRAIPG
jgi:plasmid stability protein